MSKGVRFFLSMLMLAGWFYQIMLAWAVGHDFIAPGNLALTIAFTAVVGALVGGLDYLVYQGVVSLHRREKYGFMILGVGAVILSGVFILEIGRLSVAQKGRVLGAEVAAEYERGVTPAIKAVETRLADKSVEVKNLERDVSAKGALANLVESAIEAERAGGRLPDVENRLAEVGIEFRFTGHRGESRGIATLRSLHERLRNERSALALKLEHAVHDADRTATEARQNLSEVRRDLVKLSNTELTPASYPAVLERRGVVTSKLKEIVQKLNLDITVTPPPPKTLFIVGVESAFRADASALTLWLIAFGTAFGPIAIGLLVHALYEERAHAAAVSKSAVPSTNVGHVPAPATN